MKVLLVQTSFLGDVVLSTPLTKRIHELHPGCELWWMTTPLAKPIIAEDPLVAGVITFDKRGENAGVSGMIRQAKALRAHGFDVVYSLHRSFRTSLVLFMSGIPTRIGFSESRGSWLYSEVRNRDRAAPHEVLRNLSLLGEVSSTDNAELRVVINESEDHVDIALCKSISVGERYLVMAPGSSWATKIWHSEGFREVGQRFEQLGYKVIVVGAPNESDIGKKVCQGTSFVNLIGEIGVGEMMRVVKSAALVICNDSFPLHLGSAFKIPTVAVFCSTVPEFGFGPWQNKSVVVGDRELSCRPCGRHGHKSCPTGTEACMKVSADTVHRESLGLL